MVHPELWIIYCKPQAAIEWAWFIKSGRGRKILRTLRAHLYLQPHRIKIPRPAPGDGTKWKLQLQGCVGA